MSAERYYLAKGNGSKLLHVAKWRNRLGVLQVIKIPHRSWEFARERQWLKDEVAAQKLADAVIDEPGWVLQEVPWTSWSSLVDNVKVRLFSNASIGTVSGVKFYATKPPSEWR